jgi:hypothetical protein
MSALEIADVSPPESRAKLRVNICNLSFDAIADTGSDHSALEKLTVDRLRKEGVFIATKVLPQCSGCSTLLRCTAYTC